MQVFQDKVIAMVDDHNNLAAIIVQRNGIKEFYRVDKMCMDEVCDLLKDKNGEPIDIYNRIIEYPVRKVVKDELGINKIVTETRRIVPIKKKHEK